MNLYYFSKTEMARDLQAESNITIGYAKRMVTEAKLKPIKVTVFVKQGKKDLVESGVAEMLKTPDEFFTFSRTRAKQGEE